jgi:hypothetical protein
MTARCPAPGPGRGGRPGLVTRWPGRHDGGVSDSYSGDLCRWWHLSAPSGELLYRGCFHYLPGPARPCCAREAARLPWPPERRGGRGLAGGTSAVEAP